MFSVLDITLDMAEPISGAACPDIQKKFSIRPMKDQMLCGRIKGLKFDPSLLESWYEQLKQDFSPEKSSGNYEGNSGFLLFGLGQGSKEGLGFRRHAKSLQSSTKFTSPTKYCNGYIVDTIFGLYAYGFRMTRARILTLEAKSKIPFHIDRNFGLKTDYRLHIPIQTSKKSLLQWKVGRGIVSAHLPADGSVYLINVSVLHRAKNGSNQSRSHFIGLPTKVPKFEIDRVLAKSANR